MNQDGMNITNNIVIICEELPDGTILVNSTETLEIDCDDVSCLQTLFHSDPLLTPMEESDKFKIKEIGNTDDSSDDEDDEELFDDSLESDTNSALPTDEARDNESDKFSGLEKSEMHLGDSQTPNDWSDIPAEGTCDSRQGISPFFEEEEDARVRENAEDENDNVRYYKTESESELEQLSYSDRSCNNTPVTSASGFSPVIKSSALILLKNRARKKSKNKASIDAREDKKDSLLSRVQLDDDLSDLTSTTPQIDVTESDSPSPRKSREPPEVESKRKESRPFISPIAVQRSSQFITHASGRSRSSRTDRLGAGSAAATDSTESFKRNELAMSSCVTTPREFTDQFVGESEDKLDDDDDRDLVSVLDESENEDDGDSSDDDEGEGDLIDDSRSKSIDKFENKAEGDGEIEFESENESFDLSPKQTAEFVSNGLKSENIEDDKSPATDPSVKREKCSGSKRSWADCVQTNVHPLNKQEKPVKDPPVPANPIKNFIALNKAQLHRGSGKKTYTELFLERKAKAEAKRREELAKMMGVKIPEEEKTVSSSEKKLQNSDAAGDVRLNDGSISPAVKTEFVEADVEGIGKGAAEEGERQVSTNDVVSEALSAKTSREDLKKANSDIKSSQLVLEEETSRDKCVEKLKSVNKIKESLEKESLQVNDEPVEKLVEKVKTPGRSSIPKLIHIKMSPTIGKSLRETSVTTMQSRLIENNDLLINKSSSDTAVLKKMAENEKMEAQASQSDIGKLPLSARQEGIGASDGITSTLSSGFISSDGPEGLKTSQTGGKEVAEVQIASTEMKGEKGDLEDVKTERMNRSKRKKKSGRQKSIAQKEEDPGASTTPRNKSNRDRSQRSSSLPPLKGEEMNQNGSNNNNYKPYTLKDYRQLQLDIQLGGLGPNSDRSVLQEKLQKYQRQANYAQQVMERNRKLLEARIEKSRTTFAQVMQEASDPSKDTRQRALDYAKNIRKPPAKLEKEENKDLTSTKPNAANKQVKLPPLKPANTDRWQAEGMVKSGRLETVIEEEAAGVATPVKTRPFAMDSLMENVEKLRERHAKEREIVEQLFINRSTPRKESKEKSDDKPKRKSSKKK